MMARAQGARTGLSYVVESAFGTTPGAPTMLRLPFSTHSLGLQKQLVQGSDILPDRIPRVSRHGNRNAAGDLVVDFRALDYDDLLECAFMNTFGTSGAADLTPGTTPQYLTIQEEFADIGDFRRFTGMTVASMAMNIQPNQMIQTTFSMVGQDVASSDTTLGAATAASGQEPMDSFSGSIQEGGVTIAYVSALQFTLNNGFAPEFAIGSPTAGALTFDRAVVTGSVSMFVEDLTKWDKFRDETESSIEVVLDDPTTGLDYTLLFPRVKFNTGDIPLSNPQSRILTMQFEALYDTSEATNLKLSRSA